MLHGLTLPKRLTWHSLVGHVSTGVEAKEGEGSFSIINSLYYQNMLDHLCT